ncbi:MAG: DUF2059 domain-containing protein [Paracoccaceae bacterium]
MPKRFAALALWAAASLCAAPAGWAQIPAAPPVVATDAIRQLADTLMIGPVVDILRDEGLEYGKTLEDQMFAGRGGPRWEAQVDHLYDPARMRSIFDAAFADEMAGDPVAVRAGQDFFGSELGQRILSLETEARRTLMDDAAEDAARLRFQEMEAADDPRLRQIRRFAEVNDLVEMNVVGALNSNLAFYRGMSDAGAFGGMAEEDMLADVWGQEDSVRSETEDWLFPYLTLAYASLSDDELNAYIAFSENPQGKKLNIATFTAFDRVFTEVSRDLGRAAARQMQGQDL